MHHRLVVDHLVGGDEIGHPARIFAGQFQPLLQGDEIVHRAVGQVERIADLEEFSVFLSGLLDLAVKEELVGHRRYGEAIILEPDRGFEHQTTHPLRIGAHEAHRHHAAHRMGDQIDLVELEAVQQGQIVAGELVEIGRNVGLGGFAEADLVGGDDAIAVGGQAGDHVPPIAGREIAAMEQQRRPPVGLAGRRHIHIGLAQGLALHGQIQKGDRIGIGPVLQRDPDRFLAGRRGGNARRRHRQHGQDHQPAEVHPSTQTTPVPFRPQ